MLIETGVELVEFTCPQCAHRWTGAYELLHCELSDGEVRDYFTVSGIKVLSPYAPDGAPSCLRCGSPTVARLVERRALGAPSGQAGVKLPSEGEGPSRRCVPTPSTGAADGQVSGSDRHARWSGTVQPQRRVNRV
ncbi:hypothetical protein [Streptomyces sirii]|uniref:hypothetical protein n=1 Tax=Streptomyces sirii TaxID=3127701 RepID=UPI003D36D8B0